MRNAILKLALAAPLLAALAVPPIALAQSAGTPLSAVVISVTVSIWPAIVADKKGYFKDEGLDFDFINSGASTRSVQQVAAGSAPIGSSSMVDTMRAIDKGAKVKVFLNSLAVGTHSLIGAKGIKSVKELKGKRVMTGGIGDITNLWWIAMAKANGLDPAEGRRAAVLRRDLGAARRAGRRRGRRHHAVDAAELPGGAERLCRPRPGRAVPRRIPDDDLARQRGLGEGHEKELLAFIRAHNKAVRYMSDPAHRQEVSQMLADASKSSLDDALKTWDVCMQVKAFVADGGISDGATERVRDTLLAVRRHQAVGAAQRLCRSPLRQSAAGEVVRSARCSKICSASTARSPWSPAPATASAARSRSASRRSAPP